MGKGKLTTLDVRAIVSELRPKLVGQRVANVYSLSQRIYLLKLSSSTSKHLLLIESGTRIHTTKYMREAEKQSTGFGAKLRKHLRTMRLEEIRQIGVDRVVDMQFGTGDKAFHLILEMYAQGNLILTDWKYEIIGLLRTFEYKDNDGNAKTIAATSAIEPSSDPLDSSSSTSTTATIPSSSAPTTSSSSTTDRVAVREIYPMHHAQQSSPPLTLTSVQQLLLDYKQKQEKEEKDKEEKERQKEIEEEEKKRKERGEEDDEEGINESHLEVKEEKKVPTSSTPLDIEEDEVGGEKFKGKKGKRRAEAVGLILSVSSSSSSNITSASKSTKSKRSRYKSPPLKVVLSSLFPFGPDLIEHSLLLTGLPANQSFLEIDLQKQEVIQKVITALQEAEKLYEKVGREGESREGFIVVRQEGGGNETGKKNKNNARENGSSGKKGKKNQESAVSPQLTSSTTATATSDNNGPSSSSPATVPSQSSPASTATTTAALDPTSFFDDEPPPDQKGDPTSSSSSSSLSTSSSAPSSSSASSSSSSTPDLPPASSSSSSSSASSTASSSTASPSLTSPSQSQPQPLTAPSTKPTTLSVYIEFFPLRLAQHSRGEYINSFTTIQSYPSFDDALDEFFSKEETQKEEIRLLKEKQQALAKIDRVKESHLTQLQSLQLLQEEQKKKAELIQMNLIAVEKAMESINIELANGMDWKELELMIKNLQQQNHIIAQLIYLPLKLHENKITILLSPELKHLQPKYATDIQYRPMKIDIDLSISAHLNAERYFDIKKKQQQKQIRTEAASVKAIKQAEKKTNEALKQVDIRSKIQKLRNIHWFEKFHWFITSENYLVIGGKDAQQNEMLVKKYLKKYDIYIHADVHGASSVIVKNTYPDQPIPPVSLNEAATMTICRSSAWTNKINNIESYWVYADQVSKTAPTGQYLSTGSFMIRGKKNYLPRMPMSMGLGLLFRVDESCIGKHVGERRIRGGGGGVELGEAEELKAGSGDQDERKKKKEGKKEDEEDADDDEGGNEDEEDDEDFDVTSHLVLSKASSVASAVEEAAAAAPTSKPASSLSSASSLSKPSGAARQEEKETDESKAEKKADSTGKKRLTAAERRQLKKKQDAKGGSTGSTGGSKEGEEDEDKIPSNGRSNEEHSADPAAKNTTVDSDSDSDTSSSNKRKKKSKGKSSSGSEKSAAGKNAPLSRSQRNKMKARAKYADQDEDDLEIAAQVLGLQNVEKLKKEKSTEKEKEKTAKSNTKGQERESMQKSELQLSSTTTTSSSSSSSQQSQLNTRSVPIPVDVKVCFHCKQRGHTFKMCPNKNIPSSEAVAAAVTAPGASASISADSFPPPLIDAATAASNPSEPTSDSSTLTSFTSPGAATPDPITFSAARKAAKLADEAELAALISAENLSSDPLPTFDPASSERELTSLTGRPFEDDMIQYVVPVCAPYSALQDYRYKVKLVPGTAKKGKSVKGAIAMWMKQAIAPGGGGAQERDWIATTNENEMMIVIMSNVKLANVTEPSGGRKKGKK